MSNVQLDRAVATARCDVCGGEFDPQVFQVVVPGTGRAYDSFSCAERVSIELGLDSLTMPARRLLEDLARSTVRLRGELVDERRTRAELERALTYARSGTLEHRQRRAFEDDRRELHAEQARLAALAERGRRRRLHLVD